VIPLRGLLPAIVLLALLLAGCGDSGTDTSEVTDTPALATVTQTLNTTPRPSGQSAEERARTAEADADPSLPGEYSAERLQRFIDVLYCRFDPEGFC
jgi:hypothetical protein